MPSSQALTYKQEKSLIHALFFAFGVGIMAWVPRFPEVKESLGLANGAFGTLMSTGAIGAFVGLLITGHVVHRIGLFKVANYAIVSIFGGLALIVHLHSSFSFLLCNIAIGFGVTSMHVSVNSQAFQTQERSGENLVTSSSGYWAAGALSTAILSGLLVGRVSLAIHIDVIAAIVYLSMVTLLIKLKPAMVPAKKRGAEDVKLREIFTAFHFDWRVSIAMLGVSYLEFWIGDWGTIFTKERLHIDSGVSTIPYTIFLAVMIAVRVSVEKLSKIKPIYYWVRHGTLVSGIGFGTLIAIAVNIPESMHALSFALFIAAFVVAALGMAMAGPTIMAAGARRSPHANAVAVGQTGVVNNISSFITKFIVAWTIQFRHSIAASVVIPVALIIAASFFAHVTKEEAAK
jgi:MFS family permease